MPLVRTRTALTRLLAVAHLMLALTWVLPLHGPSLPGRVNILADIAASAPLWAIGFALTGAVLLAASGRPRCARWGHGFGVVVLAGFGAASVSGALLSTPIGALWPPVFAFTFAGAHLIAQRAYVKAVN